MGTRRSASTGRRSGTKKIPVELAFADYQAVRDLAAEQDMSAGELVREWIRPLVAKAVQRRRERMHGP